jgi:hypothetical protein
MAQNGSRSLRRGFDHALVEARHRGLRRGPRWRGARTGTNVRVVARRRCEPRVASRSKQQRAKGGKCGYSGASRERAEPLAAYAAPRSWPDSMVCEGSTPRHGPTCAAIEVSKRWAARPAEATPPGNSRRAGQELAQLSGPMIMATTSPTARTAGCARRLGRFGGRDDRSRQSTVARVTG